MCLSFILTCFYGRLPSAIPTVSSRKRWVGHKPGNQVMESSQVTELMKEEGMSLKSYAGEFIVPNFKPKQTELDVFLRPQKIPSVCFLPCSLKRTLIGHIILCNDHGSVFGKAPSACAGQVDHRTMITNYLISLIINLNYEKK